VNGRDLLQKRFRVFVCLSAFILIVELTGGIYTNSLALLSDSGHVLVDLLALLMAYISMRISLKPSTKKFSYGYYRGEIFSAIINGVVLIFITLYIFYESYIRLLRPQEIKGPEMLAVSILGLAANLYVVVKMRGHEKGNLNVKGAYLHVLSDTLSSIGVVISGVLIALTGNYIFDPLAGALIGIFILTSSLRLIRDSGCILMEAAPDGIDLESLQKDVMEVDGVREVHDLHVWSITSDIYALSAHILIDAENIKSMNEIVAKINELLKSKYSISHTVIQSECGHCVYDDNRQ